MAGAGGGGRGGSGGSASGGKGGMGEERDSAVPDPVGGSGGGAGKGASGGSGGKGGSGGSGVGGGGGIAGTGGAAGGRDGGVKMDADAGAMGGAGGSPSAAHPYDCDWGPPKYTKLAPSTNPPGGLAVNNVPQFVSIGFDDNAFLDGMQWALDMLKSKMNPKGSGNHCTFDGTPARVSFFINSHVGITPPDLQALHARVYTDGHEAANHTDTHGEELKQNPDKALWTKEITTCNNYLVKLGVPRAEIVGFRAPFLEQSEATFQVVVEQKFRYDCSIQHFYWLGGFDWPYTLDAGKDTTHAYQTLPTGSYPGLWELPVNELQTTTTSNTAVTGLDYNMWILGKMTKKQVVDILKANLDIRMKGGNAAANRAPLLIGGHTDLYSRANADATAAGTASVDDRRAAIEEFIDYALAYDPAVRIVPYAEVLHWMESPVGLDGTKAK